MENIRYPKDVVDFIKSNTAVMYNENEIWYTIPLWFKSTDMDGILETYQTKDLPEYLKADVWEKFQGLNPDNKAPFNEVER